MRMHCFANVDPNNNANYFCLKYFLGLKQPLKEKKKMTLFCLKVLYL